MANKSADNVHENSLPVIEDRPWCKGRVERYSKKKSRMVNRPCKLQSTLLGDQYGEPACQWHGGRPDPESQAVQRSESVGALSYRSPEQGGVSVMGGTQNPTFNSRWQRLCSGDLNVADLDDEELARGMTRDANGVIVGRPSSMVPRHLATAMKQELFERAQSVFDSDIVQAAQILGEIARDPEVEPQHRIKAAGMIIERVMGKSAETIRIATEKPYEQLMTQIMRVEPKQLDPMIIEAQQESGDDRY